LNPESPKRLMPKLRRLFARTRLAREELNILRGILAAVNEQGGAAASKP
ncbi:MAG: tRNA (cytosine(32)/uridine(32)-2'-O)-methyltransferase TrmJ, partial [Thiobacillaceae bacterium]